MFLNYITFWCDIKLAETHKSLNTRKCDEDVIKLEEDSKLFQLGLTMQNQWPIIGRNANITHNYHTTDIEQPFVCASRQRTLLRNVSRSWTKSATWSTSGLLALSRNINSNVYEAFPNHLHRLKVRQILQHLYRGIGRNIYTIYCVPAWIF